MKLETDKDKIEYCKNKNSPECFCINFNDPNYKEVFNDLDKSDISYDKVCIMECNGKLLLNEDAEKLKNCPKVIINNIYTKDKKFINMQIGDKTILKSEGFQNRPVKKNILLLVLIILILTLGMKIEKNILSMNINS